MNEPRPQWVERSRELLDESAANLDAATLSRLNRARQAALASRARPARRWLPLSGGLAAAAVMGLALIVAWPRHPLPDPAANGGTAETSGVDALGDADADLDLLGSDDGNGAELVQDMDFYAWLDAQEHQDG